MRSTAGLGALAVAVAVPSLGLAAADLVALTSVLVFAMVAQGTNVIYGLAGHLSVAQGALWGVGAYLAAIGSDHFGFWPAVLLSIPVGALAAVIVGLPAYRVQGHYFAISTFAFAELFVIVADNLEVTGGSGGLILGGQPSFPFSDNLDPLKVNYYTALGLFVVCLVAFHLVHRSRLGVRLAAAQRNAVLATSLGMRVDKDRVIAFAISGMSAGVAGVVYAYVNQYVQPSSFDVWAGISIILIVMLGGRGYLFGPLVGACLIVFLPRVSALDPNVNQIIYGTILVVMIVLAPDGLLGAADRLRGTVRGRRLRRAAHPDRLAPTSSASKG